METEDKNTKEYQSTENTKKENKTFDFFLKTLNGMAYGLFATLIIGTIFGAIGYLFNFGAGNPFCDFMVSILGVGSAINPSGISGVLQVLTGAGIGVGVALALKFDPLKTVVLAGVGELAGYFSLSTKFVTEQAITNRFQIGDPLTIYLVCISVALLIKLILKKKTPVDVLIVPLFGLSTGLLLALTLRFPAIYVTYGMQWLIGNGTNAVPFVMGVVVAVLMGMALTAPISSAAIAAMIFIASADPATNQGLYLASGAAVIGCSCQMMGFAIQSRRDNPIGMVISIGIGTSMLQFKNILKKPIIWLPSIIASAILGPISTCLIKTQCMGNGAAGMGTSGLVGQIGTIYTMGVDKWETWFSVFAMEIIFPLILVFAIDLLFRKLNLIKDGDLVV